VLPDGSFLSEGVRISLQTIRGTDSTVYTDDNGRFEFSRLSPGRYQVIVEADPRRFEVATESVEIARTMAAVLNIVLKEKAAPGRPKVTAISAAELDPNVPGKARKEFERASSASKDGKTEEAVAHLRNAIEIYPRFLMAHNDLGAQLIESGRLDEAEKELRLALGMDSEAFNPTLNLGIVLVKKHEIQPAIDILQKAVSMQSQSPAARLYFGIALMSNSENERAERELTAAHDLGGREYAIALFHLGRLYMDRGDRQLARQYFERYLGEAPKASNTDSVRKLIATLE